MAWRDAPREQQAPIQGGHQPPQPPPPDPTEPLIGMKLEGTVKSWNDMKGFGFVTWEDDQGTARDFYCHTKAIGRLKLVAKKPLTFYVNRQPQAPDSSQLQVCAPVEGEGVQRPVCHMFQLGKCEFGDACHFPHTKLEKPTWSAGKGEGAGGRGGKGGGGLFGGGKGGGGSFGERG
eukprot:Hpha_TRINITY_DN5993_c0_g1::TRINITY_DN5993_c0_g1_i1::g.147175::m.147175